MKVVITGANGNVGRMLLKHLQASKAYQTIALVRTPAQLPCDRLISNWTSSPVAIEAIHEADVVVHLCGELFAKSAKSYFDANVETTKLVAQSRAQRVIYISYVGANLTSPNLYLQTKGKAEQILISSGKEAIVFRCPAIINTPDAPSRTETALKAVNGSSVRMLGNGKQRQRPIYSGDVVQAIATAIEYGKPGIYDLTGEEEMSADDLVRLLNNNPDIAISHIPSWLARIVSLFIPNLPPTFVEVMLRDCTGDPTRAIAEFGLKLTSVRSQWTNS